MQDADFDSILMLAGERPDIGVFLSSTPTGARKRFWQCCTDPKMHFKEFHFPSMCNPDWGPEMEEEFRAQLSEAGYTHEVLAEFGEQETGVFNKDRLDEATRYFYYTYDKLTMSQQRKIEENNIKVADYIVPPGYSGVYRPNIFRTMGIDWDKYGASSSILILDYNLQLNKFQVVRRVEVPKVEYSFDAAVKLIIELNDIYRPSFIYADRGSGEYQLETLHMYGEKHPETGLKNKLKGFQFSQSLDITDPVTHTIARTPMKPFMVNQLTITFERSNMILSPFDETLHKQLVDYSVEKITADGRPIYTSKNEHFVDALGLAHLAFVLEFPELTKTVKQVEREAVVDVMENNVIQSRVNNALRVANSGYSSNAWSGLRNGSYTAAEAINSTDHRADRPQWFNTGLAATPLSSVRRHSWGQRSISRSGSFRASW